MALVWLVAVVVVIACCLGAAGWYYATYMYNYEPPPDPSVRGRATLTAEALAPDLNAIGPVKLKQEICQGFPSLEFPRKNDPTYSTIAELYQNYDMLNPRGVFLGAGFGYIIPPQNFEHDERFILNNIPTLLSITNIQKNGWVHIANNFTYTINSAPVEDLVNILTGDPGWGCDGGSHPVPNAPIILNAAKNSSVTYAKLDNFSTYFTLPAGQTEFFPIEYQCANPGRYTLTVTILYDRPGEAGNISFHQQIVCPKRVTGWYIYGQGSVPLNYQIELLGFLKLGDFVWTSPPGYYKLDYIYPR